VVVEVDGQKLVIDPGELTTSLTDVSNVAAVVVTHEHFDHFDPKHMQTILAASPQAKVFGTSEVVSKQPGAVLAKPGELQTVGPFKLEFFGEHHQQVHPDFPTCLNVGVLVNDSLYYAGDSFVQPGKPVQVLLVPTSGPWQKMGDVTEYIKAVKPKYIVPTHNALNSEAGQNTSHTWLTMLCEKVGGMELKVLVPSESVDL